MTQIFNFIKLYKVYFIIGICFLCFIFGFKLSSIIYQKDIANIEKKNTEKENKIITEYINKQKEQAIKDQKVVDDLNKKIDDISVQYSNDVLNLKQSLEKNKSKLDNCVLPDETLNILNKSF